MVYSTVVPHLKGKFVKWINQNEFILIIDGRKLIGHKDHWIGDFMCKCATCKIEMDIRNSDTPACCVWYMDNVVIGGKNVKDCDAYEPVEE